MYLQSVYETYQVVLRCGLHWKNWTLKQIQARGGSKPVHQLEVAKPVQQRESNVHSSHARGGKFSFTVGTMSADTTPRFPVSLFNTPRENTEVNDFDFILCRICVFHYTSFLSVFRYCALISVDTD